MAKVTRSRVGITTYLIPGASLSVSANVESLRETIDACVTDNEFELILDLSGVGVVNSEALELLLDTQDRLTRVGGRLRVTHANAVITDVLRLTGVAAVVGSLDEDSAPGAEPAPEVGEKWRRIGELLVARGLVTESQVQEALELQQRSGERMAQIMVQKEWLSEKDLLDTLSQQLGLPAVWVRPGVYEPEVARLIDVEMGRRLKVLPLFRVRGVLYLATPDPQSVPSLDAVHDITQLKVKPILASAGEILAALDETHADGLNLSEYIGDLENDLELVQAASEDHVAIDEMAAGSPVINLINGLIQRAVADGASDIHIEPTRSRCRIRIRVDGVLYPIMTPPIDVHAALVSRLKVMANLDIAERRLPQDGRIQVVTRRRVVDVRFSSLPGIFGEKVVLRVLDKDQAILDIDRLGMTPANMARFRGLLARSYGLLLVTGPTGSGKTTSLYAAINSLNSSERNIITIEDPVEYQVDGINQNQVKGAIGLSFAKILKHALRQDPDVLLVGEVRERETAEIAVHAALTGHLVLSTLHTNDSIGAVTRMLDMGIEPFLLSSALIGVMAQRLLRTVCSECKTTYAAPPETLEQFGIKTDERVRLARGRGCAACFDSGYKGRLAIHEIVATDPELQRLIVSNPSKDELDAYMRTREVDSLLDDGIDRALKGLTTFEEVVRVASA